MSDLATAEQPAEGRQFQNRHRRAGNVSPDGEAVK
jgi:hypothetical protein